MGAQNSYFSGASLQGTTGTVEPLYKGQVWGSCPLLGGNKCIITYGKWKSICPLFRGCQRFKGFTIGGVSTVTHSFYVERILHG